MLGAMKSFLENELQSVRDSGLYKGERIIVSPQGTRITLQDGADVLNLCSNNYLGLSGHPEIIEAAKRGIERWGYGLSSVRFICGTQAIHKDLERKVADFLGMEAAILYSSCFDANGGLFETLLGPDDAVISDQLNHASIIDGIRLCKAKRLRFKNNDMTDLEARLREASDARFRMIATDGVFSMDGIVADLKRICDLAEQHEALVMVDDSHGIGACGRTGRGSIEVNDVFGRVDIVTGTFGKALGGASGGFTAGRKEIVELLRQRSRPYLFSNTLAPGVVATSLRAIEMLEQSPELVETLQANTDLFRRRMREEGFDIPEGSHPIVPLMLGDAERAVRMAERLLSEGIYVIAFSYPVVPRDAARIRVQMSAAFSADEVERAVQAFAKVGKQLGIAG